MNIEFCISTYEHYYGFTATSILVSCCQPLCWSHVGIKLFGHLWDELPTCTEKGPVPKSGRGPQKNRKFDQETYFPNHDIGEFTASLDESTSSYVLLISHDIPVAPKNKWDVMDTIWDVYIYNDIYIYMCKIYSNG
jgi:hypothetical protein